MQALFGFGDGSLDLLGLFALLPGRPIQLAETVQDGAADLVFRVGLELDVLGWIEVVDGGDQPDHACRDQVVQAHALRQLVVNASGDQTNLRQILQNQAIPFGSRYALAHDIGAGVTAARVAAARRPGSRHGRSTPIVPHALATALLSRPSSSRSAIRSFV